MFLFPTRALFSIIVLAACCLAFSGCGANRTEERLTMLEDRLDAVEAGLKGLKEQEEFDVAMLGERYKLMAEQVTQVKEAQLRTEEKKGRPAASPVTALAVRKPASLEAQDYQTALQTLEKGNPQKAEALFREFLHKYPKSQLTPNALYWLGESHYSLKQYDKAILNFQDCVSRFPKHSKAQDSLLKTGYAYERLGDKENARFYLKSLLEQYPNYPKASLARAALQRLQ